MLFPFIEYLDRSVTRALWKHCMFLSLVVEVLLQTISLLWQVPRPDSAPQKQTLWASHGHRGSFLSRAYFRRSWGWRDSFGRSNEKRPLCFQRDPRSYRFKPWLGMPITGTGKMVVFFFDNAPALWIASAYKKHLWSCLVLSDLAFIISQERNWGSDVKVADWLFHSKTQRMWSRHQNNWSVGTVRR